VLNRHGGFKAPEMHRILKPGGVFLSEQVGGDNLADLTAKFGASLAYPDNTLDRVCEAFIALGCKIRRSEEWRGPVTFFDVGALVYFLKAVPWVIKDFDVRRCEDVLRALHRDCVEGRVLRFTYSRFFVEVVRTWGRTEPTGKLIIETLLPSPHFCSPFSVAMILRTE
jgi:SAM-dependent methyltransferase